MKIEQCPFCGKDPKFTTRKDQSLWNHNIVDWYTIGCSDCDYSIIRCQDKDELLNLWNQQKRMNALEQLAKWDRKYYMYKLETGRHIQPGDGLYVTLYGGGRTVQVGDYELEDVDNEVYPTIAEVILEAIRRWHADDTAKNYSVIYHLKSDGPEYNGEHILRYKDQCGKSIEVRLIAKNEQEALEKAASGYSVQALCEIGKPAIWEMTKNWSH